jgi:hypothetical protein
MSASPRRALVRLPDLSAFKGVENKSILAIQLFYGEGFSRKTILEKNLVPRGVYDRAKRAFLDDRIPGENGRPGQLSPYQEGILIAVIENEMYIGHVLSFREITAEVLLSTSCCLTIFTFSGSKNQKLIHQGNRFV